MRRAIIGVLVITLGLMLRACNTTEPPNDNQSVNLILEDVSCIEAWITLTTTNLQLPTTATLKQTNQTGETISQILNLNTKDSLLYIDSLLPNQIYKFQSVIQSINQSSNELSVTTMDTTSHNFTWQTWTFGEHSSSVLRDVAIINENNIIAVGEIYMNDSLGQHDPHAYNAVHWDGNEWKLFRVMFYAGCSNPTIMVPYPASSIIVFNENDIWISMYGDQVARLDGMTQVETHCMPVSFSINKIWGTSSNDLYAVGSNGTIVRFNGTLWWRMGTITDLTIYDIWGDLYGESEDWEILAVASDYYHNPDRKIIRILQNRLEIVSDEPLYQPLRALWFKFKKQYYVTGSGVYQKHYLSDLLWRNKPQDITSFSIYAIRGNNINDVTGVGAYGKVIHFNGKNWKTEYQDPLLSFGAYYAIDVSTDITVAVGTEQSKAVITTGKR